MRRKYRLTCAEIGELSRYGGLLILVPHNLTTYRSEAQHNVSLSSLHTSLSSFTSTSVIYMYCTVFAPHTQTHVASHIVRLTLPFGSGVTMPMEAFTFSLNGAKDGES